MRAVAAVSTLAAGSLVLAACSGPAEKDSGISESSTITVAWEAPLNELNTSSSNGNATQNAVITSMLNGAFWYYNESLELVHDESFGTFEKTSDDPLTVKYTFADDVKWSDGTPTDAADLLLEWAATSNVFNNVEAEEDPETGEVLNQDAIDAGVYFDGNVPGRALITETPEITDDGKTITFVYSKKFADWESDFQKSDIPAHVAGQLALGIEDADEAKAAVVTAIQENDVEALSKLSKVWNSGFEFTSLPADEKVYVSNGAFLMTEYVENSHMTLEANPEYKGDLKPKVDSITIRYIEDPMAQVTALQNGEVDLIGPQATADVRAAIEALDGVESLNGVEGTYEHVDLVFANGGPFDPATYGGDAEKARKVRQAFLKAIPRQQIVDNLIVPLNPDAEVRNSFIIIPGSSDYDDMVKGNGSDAYTAAEDIEGAKALLAEAGVTTPVNVRFAFNGDNTRRQTQFALITETAAAAGFTLVDASKPAAEWGTLLSTGQDQYDASLFGWQSTSTAVTESDANYRTGGVNNYGKYSNAEVDALFDELQVETDPAKQIEIQIKVEKILWNDAFGTTIFQFPAIQAWKNITGVTPISISPTIFAGYWNWETTGTTAGDEPSATS
ncbi:ABC transporter family substrate-binding protein [Cellulomonas timonensis]|uniref:ABC transporter family substrate-binding protein n=1 Tax=Cellulomonas timonensis TaxID=1689271 RepID=UPI0009EED418|nr:ABC transporter family substrate-binding protein [Cellulomonas timonensis]